VLCVVVVLLVVTGEGTLPTERRVETIYRGSVSQYYMSFIIGSCESVSCGKRELSEIIFQRFFVRQNQNFPAI